MLEAHEKNGILVVSLNGTDRLNAMITEPVKEGLLKFYNQPGTKLVLDLNEIKFIDSSGFSVLLSAMKAANNQGGQFKICNINSDVMELFQVLQLHNVFEIYNSLDDCLNSFKE